MRTILLALLALLTFAPLADAVVLCAKPKKNGTFNTSVMIREACRKSETQLDLAALGVQGLQGPQGDAGPAGTPAWDRPCPSDSVRSGGICIDAYEASVWRIPPDAAAVLQHTQDGTVTVDELTASGAVPLGTESDNYAPCEDSGQNCTDDIYAVSLPGVTPSSRITWFQAQAACENAGKRLPSNAEWQAAVIGTPDPGSNDALTGCNSQTGAKALTGSRSGCRSARGAFDMVGNVYEWVADWVPRSTTCGTWSGGVSPTSDAQCLAGAATSAEPGALLRGGDYLSGADAGPLAVVADRAPSAFLNVVGFRCAR